MSDPPELDPDATVVRPLMADGRGFRGDDEDYLAPDAGRPGRLTIFLAAALIMAIGIVIGIQLQKLLG